jgi:leucyl-tRNA synthetase
VTEDIEGFRFNTMVAALMELTTIIARAKSSRGLTHDVLREAEEGLILMMAPSAPHIADELWSRLGHRTSVHLESWPEFDADLARDVEVTLVVQVDGKLRERLAVAPGLPEEEAVRLAMASPRVAAALGGKSVKRRIYRTDRLLNLVLG